MKGWIKGDSDLRRARRIEIANYTSGTLCNRARYAWRTVEELTVANVRRSRDTTYNSEGDTRTRTRVRDYFWRLHRCRK